MRSIAEQSVAELGGAKSVLARQKRDHVELGALIDQLAESSPERAGPLLIRIYRLVFPHAFAEEAVLWPVIRRVLPDGDELTLRVEREHQPVNELVTRLEALPRGSPEWRQTLDEVIRTLQQDVRDEEDELLPRLQEKLSGRELRRLGASWELVRRIAPTRAHPVVSRRPPGNVLSALPLTLIDRTRDRVDLWRYRYGGGARASQALTQAAHATEHLPGLKLGEDPSTRVRGLSPLGWALVGAGAAAGFLLLARRDRR